MSASIFRNIFSSSQSGCSRHYSALVSASFRKQLRNQNPTIYSVFYRHNSSVTQPVNRTERTATVREETGSPRNAAKPASTLPTSEPHKSDTPTYEITFTCKPCQTRSTHKISKQGYHSGTILITCPDCKNRHLICDHLKVSRSSSKLANCI